MARARNIKFGFYKNEDLASCSLLARFIFPGLWMLADREGRLEDRPLRIKAEVLPYDGGDIDACLNELQAAGMLLRYQVGNAKYIQVLAFKKHQTPHVKEAASTIPAPDAPSKAPDKPEAFTPISTNESPVLAPCEPEESTSQAPPDVLNPDVLNPDSKRKTRRLSPLVPLPDGFSASPAVQAWYSEKGYTEPIARHLEAFVGYARAHGRKYANWDQAFMNAIREDWARARGPANGSGNYASVGAEAIRLLEERDAEARPAETH